MDFDLLTLLSFAAIILSIHLLLHYLLSKPTASSQKKPPEAGGAWPIVGHLPSLSVSKAPHITLGNMADKYGPIFSIKMGVHKTVIVSSSKIAKDWFTTNDKVLANRPKSLAAEILGNNYALFGFSSYGPYWREIRKIATLQMLSNHRLEMLSHIRESEVKSSMKEIYEDCVKNNKVLVVDMKKWFGDITSNVVFRMVVGQRFNETSESDDQKKRAMKEFFDLTGSFVLADAIPYLRWLDLGGYEKAMKKTAKELYDFVQIWLDQHKEKRNTSGVQLKEEEIDFMHVLLSIFDTAQEISSYDVDTVIKSACLVCLFFLLLSR